MNDALDAAPGYVSLSLVVAKDTDDPMMSEMMRSSVARTSIAAAPLRILMTRRTPRDRLIGVQYILSSMGYLTRQNFDGTYGKATAAAIKAFRKTNDLPEGGLRDLRAALPGITIVQVVHVDGEDAIARARAASPHADAILLDSGNQKLAVKELGGTGRRHDWTISRRIRETAGVPVYLAGGLTAANVADAITTVRPFGLDLCSGVRTDGRLDAEKLAAFFAAARAVPPAALC